MPAYVIVDIQVTDPSRYEEYKQLAHATVLAHGGRYVVRGGAAERLEGNRTPHRVVVLEFPSTAAARAWWSSDDYAPAKALRQQAATSDMILVEGV